MAKKKLPKPETEKALERFRALAEKRYEIAMAAYNSQDKGTQQALDRIRDRLVIGSTGLVTVKGQVIQVDIGIIEHNAMYVAIEIVKDLALLDIRVANYKFPEVLCAECGATLAKTKRSKRKGKR